MRLTTCFAATLTAAAVCVTGLPAAADDSAGTTGSLASTDTRTVTFRGVQVEVPAEWPVREMSGRPGCVRMDRQVVYVGDPSRVTCPADLVGRVSAVHLTTRSTSRRAYGRR